MIDSFITTENLYFLMLMIAAAFSEVLNSSVGIGLVVVFFASVLVLITTTFGFATRGENQRVKGLDKN